MKYEVFFTSKFRKDIKLAHKKGKNIDKLFSVVESIANDDKLDARYRDHELSGDFAGFRECHIEPDWLLIYRKDSERIILYLLRTGSHSDLF